MTKVHFLVILAFLSFGSVAQAHELLPKEIIEYIKENPDATPEEMKAFANSQGGEIAEKFNKSSSEEILNIIKNPESTFIDNFGDFFKLGVTHILSGFDHILFVLTLLLVFVSTLEILKLVTTFTVAHSITLILAGTGIVVLSPGIVEPVIALSIAIMAIATGFFPRHKIMTNPLSKISLVFFFGLFHGLGFAGLLQEIAIPENKLVSSLFAFNIGIEIGQLIIIALIIPIILYVKNKTWYGVVVKIAALSIALLSTFWFLERIGLLA